MTGRPIDLLVTIDAAASGVRAERQATTKARMVGDVAADPGWFDSRNGLPKEEAQGEVAQVADKTMLNRENLYICSLNAAILS